MSTITPYNDLPVRKYFSDFLLLLLVPMNSAVSLLNSSCKEGSIWLHVW